VLKFLHGDFNKDNYLYQEGSSRGIIDFEYGGYGFPAIDLANAINECHFNNVGSEFPFWEYHSDKRCND
jgi:thiamine kinase-like enzyme